jgi:hypothetical protein
MRLRRRTDERDQPQAEEPLPQPALDTKAAGDFLAAADEAISRVLSGDAETFLRDSRQEGGQ